jgi:hypothetical protein
VAVGDVVSAFSTAVGAGSFVDIQPSGTLEWVIHNIYHENDAALQWYDGTNSIEFDIVTGAHAWVKQNFHVTNSRRIRIRNAAGSSQDIGYDGIVTHT